MIVRTKTIGHYSLSVTYYSLLITQNTNTRIPSPICINCILFLIHEGNLDKHEQLYSETTYVPERNKRAK